MPEEENYEEIASRFAEKKEYDALKENYKDAWRLINFLQDSKFWFGHTYRKHIQKWKKGNTL